MSLIKKVSAFMHSHRQYSFAQKFMTSYVVTSKISNAEPFLLELFRMIISGYAGQIYLAERAKKDNTVSAKLKKLEAYKLDDYYNEFLFSKFGDELYLFINDAMDCKLFELSPEIKEDTKDWKRHEMFENIGNNTNFEYWMEHMEKLIELTENTEYDEKKHDTDNVPDEFKELLKYMQILGIDMMFLELKNKTYCDDIQMTKKLNYILTLHKKCQEAEIKLEKFEKLCRKYHREKKTCPSQLAFLELHYFPNDLKPFLL